MRSSHAPFIVLVVEDEPIIRMCAAEALADGGFTMLEACYADEAIEALEQNCHRVSVVFTDVNMPGSMDGIALAHHTRRHWPHIALLVTSGRPRSVEAGLPHGSRFLAKPYDLEHAVLHVRHLAEEGLTPGSHAAGER